PKHGSACRREEQLRDHPHGVLHFDLLRHASHPTLPSDQEMSPAPQQPDTVMTYDVLGRRESMADSDTGPETYRYDAFGELKRTEDANGGVTTYEHDDLGRQKLL